MHGHRLRPRTRVTTAFVCGEINLRIHVCTNLVLAIEPEPEPVKKVVAQVITAEEAEKAQMEPKKKKKKKPLPEGWKKVGIVE